MTATNELRRLLDERGVEWWPMHDIENDYHEDRDTEFLVWGCKHVAHEWGCRLQVDMLTPAQAIAATLGRAVDKGEPQGADGHLDQSQIDWLRLMPDGWDPSRRMVVVDSDEYLIPTDRIVFETDETGFASKVCLDGTWYYPGRGECEVYEDEASCDVFGVEMEYRCCECETSFVAWKPDECNWQVDVKPNFCPNCGRRVKR